MQWLADNYTLQNRDAEASSLFDRLLSVRNDVGLLAKALGLEVPPALLARADEVIE